MDERAVRNLAVLAGVFSGSIVVANILAAAKLTALSLAGLTIVLPAGFIAYAVTFPITDAVGEVYGRRAAYYIVLSGLATELVMLILLWLGLLLPPLDPAMNEALEGIVGMNTRIVAASLVAYLASQTHDVWAFHFWKVKTGGRWLWLRNNASTAVSQLIDTALFITLAFYGVFPAGLVGAMILGQWIGKLVVAALDTPFVYLAVALLRRSGAERLEAGLPGAGALK